MKDSGYKLLVLFTQLILQVQFNNISRVQYKPIIPYMKISKSDTFQNSEFFRF